MKITIECEPEELKKVLPAIGGSEEYKKIKDELSTKASKSFVEALIGETK
ncbi:hypothetical protein [Loigolactobacillus bifermentans]|nr:hypothetical protein [Loigolactobacillus bifermentans]QGG59105.1 hypothetical protein LB003_00755 [Loigolactobacillus bifermentans]